MKEGGLPDTITASSPCSIPQNIIYIVQALIGSKESLGDTFRQLEISDVRNYNEKFDSSARHFSTEM
ncbi:hypothetical protein JZU68_05660 [bacterium]|nr:hypothetical protein [bacterium]